MLAVISKFLLWIGRDFGRSCTFGVEDIPIGFRPMNESPWHESDFKYLLEELLFVETISLFCRIVFGVAGVSNSLQKQQKKETLG